MVGHWYKYIVQYGIILSGQGGFVQGNAKSAWRMSDYCIISCCEFMLAWMLLKLLNTLVIYQYGILQSYIG